MSRTPIRLTGLGLFAAGLVAGAAMDASAQSRCGATYQIERGDTLHSISQRCRVALARIMDLNPKLGDPRDIAVGTEIQLEPHDSDDDQQAERDWSQGSQTYRVEPGETLFSIAQEVGVSLMELLNANPELDPLALAVGEVLNLPGDGPSATVDVRPPRISPGETITVQARNLRPNDWVTIGAGPQASEWSSLREIQVGPDGTLHARVAAPDWADPGENLVFVVDTDRGMTLKSEPVHVIAADNDGRERLVLEGWVASGPECSTLRTPEGEIWSMVSEDVRFTEGEYVEVTGWQADASFCMRGIGTIEVASIEEVQPPARGPGGGNRVTIEGYVEHGVECHVIETPAGEIWAVVSNEVEFTEGEYVEVTGRQAEMSICMQGQGTIEVSTIDEVQPPPGERSPN